MDFTWNGYEFLFEIEKIRLLYGKYNYAAKTTEVRDDETRTIVATSIGPEVYGRLKSSSESSQNQVGARGRYDRTQEPIYVLVDEGVVPSLGTRART